MRPTRSAGMLVCVEYLIEKAALVQAERRWIGQTLGGGHEGQSARVALYEKRVVVRKEVIIAKTTNLPDECIQAEKLLSARETGENEVTVGSLAVQIVQELQARFRDDESQCLNLLCLTQCSLEVVVQFPSVLVVEQQYCLEILLDGLV